MTALKYDAWLVDLDGTLYVARWVKLLMAAELALFGWSALRALRQFRRQHEALRHEHAAGTVLASSELSPFALQLARTAKALAMPLVQLEPLVRLWMFERPSKWIALFPRRALLDELREYKARGGRLALVSDYPAERKLDALGVRDLFDVIVANGERHSPQRLKPDPEGYLSAAQLLGVSPARCLVIGDRKDADGEAARAANMSFRLIG